MTSTASSSTRTTTYDSGSLRHVGNHVRERAFIQVQGFCTPPQDPHMACCSPAERGIEEDRLDIVRHIWQRPLLQQVRYGLDCHKLLHPGHDEAENRKGPQPRRWQGWVRRAS